MDLAIFAQGILLGFSIAAPVGPIGVLCIRRTLSHGRAIGLVSGLGAATADAFYGSIAAFGLTLVSNILIGQQMWLRLAGGAFLCYLGIKTFSAATTGRPATDGPGSEEADQARGKGLVGAYGSTLFLTLTNPLTILSFAAIFAGLGLGARTGNNSSALALVAGVFTGSAAWWFILSGGVGLLRSRLDRQALNWINRISGAVISGFGVIALLSVWF